MNIMQMTKQTAYPAEMIVLSHSTRGSFHACPRKGIEFKQLYGQPTAEREENYAAEVGHAIHVGVGHYLLHQNIDIAAFAYMMRFPFHLEKMARSGEKRTMESGLVTLEALLHSQMITPYNIAQIRLADGSIKPCIEVPFAIEIKNAPLAIPVWFVGFMDLILYDETRDRFVVVDIKTTTRPGEREARYRFDEQVLPYALILEHALGRAIEEIEVVYLEATIDVREPLIQKFEFVKRQQDIQDWYYGLCDDIERIAKYYREQHFPRTTDGHVCENYGRKCFFFDECHHRDIETLRKIMPTIPRRGLFTNGAEPWIIASLEYQRT